MCFWATLLRSTSEKWKLCNLQIDVCLHDRHLIVYLGLSTPFSNSDDLLFGGTMKANVNAFDYWDIFAWNSIDGAIDMPFRIGRGTRAICLFFSKANTVQMFDGIDLWWMVLEGISQRSEAANRLGSHIRSRHLVNTLIAPHDHRHPTPIKHRMNISNEKKISQSNSC